VVKFLSKMFHPNIYADGGICLDILQYRYAWKLSINKIKINGGIRLHTLQYKYICSKINVFCWLFTTHFTKNRTDQGRAYNLTWINLLKFDWFQIGSFIVNKINGGICCLYILQ
jgi:hypothetical protein